MNLRPVGAEFFRWTEGQAQKHEESFRSFVNVPKNACDRGVVR